MENRGRVATFFGALITVISVMIIAGLAAAATKKPATVAEIALYNGPDRQQILEEGARKEGNLVFYTSGTLTQAVRPVVDSFQKKYPFIKMDVWRGDSVQLVARISQEIQAGRPEFDVIENAQHGYLITQEAGILQPFHSPNLAFIEDGAIVRAPTGGAIRAGFRESGHGMGYNTKLISKANLPKNYKDLLDPTWKGKVAIAGSENGISFAGTMLDMYGEEFVRRLAAQNFDVHMVSARAILDMVINGEYWLSPTITDAHVSESKVKGAPVEWIPIEPVHVNVGQISISSRARHPYAAMLFVDHELSKESGEIHRSKGYLSSRKDVAGEQRYKRNYGPHSKEELKKWNDLFQSLFVKR